MEEKVIDNMKPYEHPTMYEEQLLDELTGRSEVPMVSTMTGTDDYGYSANDYVRNSPEYQVRPDPPHEESSLVLNSSDYSFLNSVNTFY
jgi:hypothetical protein